MRRTTRDRRMNKSGEYEEDAEEDEEEDHENVEAVDNRIKGV